MIDMIKRSMLTGLGMMLKTRDEVERLARDWADNQKLSEEEGRRFIDDLLKRYDDSMDKMEEKVRETVNDVMKRTNIATREEVDELRKEVERLKMAMKPGGDAS